jgi:putative nucleotidyltransferase with HDIG domain
VGLVFKRAKQVWAALTARITADDQLYVAEYLNSREQGLFWQMDLPEQYHALRVAQTAMELAEAYPAVDRELLRKAALLHDIGKMRGDISTADKIVTVLVHRFTPRMGRIIARPGKGNKIANLRHAFYIYGHHARRGAKSAANAGVEPAVVELIRRHHQKSAHTDSVELKLLRKADNRH